MKITDDKIKEILKSKNIGITKNRINIFQCLNDEHHFHSIKDIITHTGMNTKSVYNNIKTLSDVGIIDSYSSGGIVKYALNDSFIGKGHSIHITNKENDIDHIDVNEKIFKDIEKEIKKAGYEVNSLNIFVNVK